MSAFPLEREVEYPSSDGKPMAETDLHRKEMVYVTEALAAHFRDSPDVYVSGNILLPSFLDLARCLGDPWACARQGRTRRL